MESDPREVELNFNSSNENNLEEMATLRNELAQELNSAVDIAESAPLEDAASSEVFEPTAMENSSPDASAVEPMENPAVNPMENPETAPLLRSRYPSNRAIGTPPLVNHNSSESFTAAETVAAGKSYGVALRCLREYQGLTYDDIKQVTLIPVNYLEALENEDLSALPPLVYVIAFIKTLCRFYKVSNATFEELVAELRSNLKCSCQNDELLNTIDVDSSGAIENERKLKRIILSIAGGAAAVILIIVLAVFLSTRSRQTPAPAPGGNAERVQMADNGNFDPNLIYTLLEPPTLDLPKLPVAE